MAQAVNFLVDLGILLDVGISGGEISLGLVVVVVTDKIMHRIFRKESLKLLEKLGGQRFVMRNDQRGLIDLGDHVSHRKGLTRPGHA